MLRLATHTHDVPVFFSPAFSIPAFSVSDGDCQGGEQVSGGQMSCIHKKDGQTVMERRHGADLANALNAQIKGAAAATSTTAASAECPSPTAMLSAVDSSCRRTSTVNRSSSTPPCTATSHLGCGAGCERQTRSLCLSLQWRAARWSVAVSTIRRQSLVWFE